MIRTQVTNCWAAFGNDGEIVLPVASFEVKYRVNEIPSLKLVPALGRSLRSGKQSNLAKIKRGMKAEVFLSLNGTTSAGTKLTGDRKIMSGWVQSEGMSDTSGLTGRWLSGEISIIHRAGKLAGSPAVSYTFAGSHTGTSISVSTGRSWSTNPLRNANNTNSSLFPLNQVLGELFSRKNIDIGGLFPSTFLRAMVIALVSGSEIAGGFAGAPGVEGVFSLADIKAMVKDYKPANLSNFADWLGNGFKVSETMLTRYQAGWLEQNIWQALLATAEYMFLSILPFNEGFYIANPFGWLTTPNLTLGSHEYTSIRQSTAMNVQEPVNGVVLSIPPLLIKDTGQKGGGNSQISWNYYYPPMKTGDGAPIYRAALGDFSGLKIDAGMYYHWRSLPDWLYPFVTVQFGSVDYSGTRKSKVSKAKPDTDLAKWADTVGTRAAKMVYGQLLAEQAAASLIMPYREDIMPGTRLCIRTDSSVNADTSIIGDTLYGMVNNVKIYCSTVEENPVLQMEVQVTHLRGASDNQEPPDGVALTEEPLYQDSWVGMDLFGNTLTKIPEGSQPDKIPNKTYKTTGGGADPAAAAAVENLQI